MKSFIIFFCMLFLPVLAKTQIDTNSVNGWRVVNFGGEIISYDSRFSDTAIHGIKSQSFHVVCKHGAWIEIEKTFPFFIQKKREIIILNYLKKIDPINYYIEGKVTFSVFNGSHFDTIDFFTTVRSSVGWWRDNFFYPNQLVPNSFNKIRIKFNLDFFPYQTSNIDFEILFDYFYTSEWYIFQQVIDDFGDPITGITPISSKIPKKFSLSQNYPNPFNPKTKIQFSIPKTSYTELKVYDVLGREVAILVNKEMNAGNYQVDFNPKNLTSGTYFYRLTAEDFTETKRMMIVK